MIKFLKKKKWQNLSEEPIRIDVELDRLFWLRSKSSDGVCSAQGCLLSMGAARASTNSGRRRAAKKSVS